MDRRTESRVRAYEGQSRALHPQPVPTLHDAPAPLTTSFFNDTATTEIYTIAYTLSLHDALP
eukprot:COSAG01_NODE_68524_length_264_cov_0.436364_1_plen_61_part_10